MVRKVIYQEPPLSALGWVVWPDEVLPNYRITVAGLYDPNRKRKPGLAKADLDAAIKRAMEMVDTAPQDYAVFVVVE